MSSIIYRIASVNLNRKLTCLVGPSQSVKLLSSYTCVIGYSNVSPKTSHFSQPARNTSFLTNLTADQLWKGVTSVSNAGKRRGRGKGTGRKITRDLNRGQILGCGKINMVWPGLNAPVISGKEVVQQRELPPNKDLEERILQMRNSARTFSVLKLDSLERGYTGAKLPGRKIGPPDPVGDERFENFQSIVLELRIVASMSGNMGRARRFRALAVTGNGNGLAGFGIGKGPDGMTALRRAKSRAAHSLCYIDRFEDHTICHDFYTQYRHAKAFVKKVPKGYGLVCHRIIKSICELVGITDLYAKVENSKNPLFLTTAFFDGLVKQKTHQELAEAMRLNVIETRKERDNFPRLIATPKTNTRKRQEIPKNEITDFKEIIDEGRVQLVRPRIKPFYESTPCFQVHLKKMNNIRHHKKMEVEILARYDGQKKSFLTIREEQRLKAKQLKEVEVQK